MNQQIVVVLLISVLLCSCSDDSNPGTPGPYMTLIGGIGSQRTYLTTESWFVPFTDTPLVAVPDSLLSRITLSDSLRRGGVVALNPEVESVEWLDTSAYNSLNLPLPRFAYKMSKGGGWEYNLYDEVQRLASAYSYRIPTYQRETDWYEDATQVRALIAPDNLVIYPSLPWLKKPLYVGDTWIRYQEILSSSGGILSQTSVNVLGLVDVTTKAGTFRAIKLVLFSLGGSPSDSSNKFEYYVPGVGLVLYEVDREVCKIFHPHGGESTRICFRQVIRKELTSFNVLP